MLIGFQTARRKKTKVKQGGKTVCQAKMTRYKLFYIKSF